MLVSAIAFVVGTAAPSSADSSADPASGTGTLVTVLRPAGAVILSDISVDGGGTLRVTIIDTRAEDPGWAVTVSGRASTGWTPFVVDHTPAFDRDNGRPYAQEVSAGAPDSTTLAKARPHHGLGIAHLAAKLRLPVTGTVVVTVA